MLLILKLITLTVIIVLGLKVSLSEGMIFEKIGKFFEKKVDEGHRAYDILICPWCMNTLQVFTAHAAAFGLGVLPIEFNWPLLIRLPFVICGASFISGNLWNLYETVNRIKDKNENEAIYFENLNNEQ